MPTQITQDPAVNRVVSERSVELPLQHDPNAPGRNVVNNRAFSWYRKDPERAGIMVEVVRRGPKHTRVRSNLHANGQAFLVKTENLVGYVHVDGLE